MIFRNSKAHPVTSATLEPACVIDSETVAKDFGQDAGQVIRCTARVALAGEVDRIPGAIPADYVRVWGLL